MSKQSFLGAQKFEHAAHTAWRRVEGEGVILDLDTSVYYSINPVGVLIWERLGAGMSLDGVVDEICREFDVKPQEARRHIEKLANQLIEEKLLLPAET